MSLTNINCVAVLGAAGKMGRGIALLLLQNMEREEQSLLLCDQSSQALKELRVYLEKLLGRFLEKKGLKQESISAEVTKS